MFNRLSILLTNSHW